MKKYRFSTEQKAALWNVYDGNCGYCGQKIRWQDVTIDHILPEDLLSKPEELERIVMEFELGDNFTINDYCNWMPAHPSCNQSKGAKRYSKGTILWYLERAKGKLAKVQEQQIKLTKEIKADTVLSKLETWLRKGIVTTNEVAEILNRIERPFKLDAIVITFGTNTDDLWEQNLLPDDAPAYYPHLCDWLEENLITQLESILSCSFYYSEASGRTGETLSVRLAFLGLDFHELDNFVSDWWEILEIAYFSEIYDSDPTDFFPEY